MEESQVQQCFIPMSVISHGDVQTSYPTSEPTESAELSTEESKANDFMDVKESESELEVHPDEVNEVISEVIGGTHPFDISIFDSCVSIQETSQSSTPVHLNSPQEEKVTESYVATERTQDNTNPSHDVGEATSSSAIVYRTPKKPAAKRKRRAPVARIYYCDWCRVAQFKSGQGLRFHRTLRCSAREKHLGENYFRCSNCPKTFVTRKGLAQHQTQYHSWDSMSSNDPPDTSTPYIQTNEQDIEGIPT